jgi:acetylglutamate kinase
MMDVMGALTTRGGGRLGTIREALPYIREFYGRIMVIEYGGLAITDPELRREFIQDVLLLRYVGVQPIVVHGTRVGDGDVVPEVSEALLARLDQSGLPPDEVARMVMLGKTNKDLVAVINRVGDEEAEAVRDSKAERFRGVGVSGGDGQLLTVAQTGQDSNYPGATRVVRTDAKLVRKLIDGPYIPVVAAVGIDEQGRSVSVNPDHVAATLAVELGAYKLVFMTDAAGWLVQPDDATSRVSVTNVEQVERNLEGCDPTIASKLAASVEALDGRPGEADRLRSAHIVSGRHPHALMLELFTDEGIGTMVWPRAEQHEEHREPLDAWTEGSESL